MFHEIADVINMFDKIPRRSSRTAMMYHVWVSESLTDQSEVAKLLVGMVGSEVRGMSFVCAKIGPSICMNRSGSLKMLPI